ncbi:MAG: hypothetical protein ACYSQZ_00015 [Planctomycetota bacterium]|jgi:hypothetical protein
MTRKRYDINTPIYQLKIILLNIEPAIMEKVTAKGKYYPVWSA